MTSINLKNLSSLFRGISTLPEHCREGEVILVTGDHTVFPDIEVSLQEKRRGESLVRSSAGQFFAARRLLRMVLSRIIKCDPRDVPIVIDTNGKPYLSDRSLSFSIAHSGECVGVAVSLSGVGLDLEQERDADVCALAKRFFSEEESAIFRRQAGLPLFFKHWTCREAAAKADGRGLAALLAKTKVHAGETDVHGLGRVSIASEEWRALHWREEGGMHGAMAFKSAPTVISWCDLRGGAMI